jgi:hypothetical protein
VDPTFIQARIDSAKAAISIAEDAEAALMVGGLQTYKLDTGQNVTSVTKFNITELRNYIDALYNRCAVLEARLSGSGVITARPAW